MNNLLYEPLQNRSRETLHRILEAAETIMANKPFEKITIAEIVKQAKTTTGSFYARFPDKEALLARLFDQHVSEIADGIDESLAEIATLSPEARIDHIVAIIGNGFRLRPFPVSKSPILRRMLYWMAFNRFWARLGTDWRTGCLIRLGMPLPGSGMEKHWAWSKPLFYWISP